MQWVNIYTQHIYKWVLHNVTLKTKIFRNNKPFIPIRSFFSGGVVFSAFDQIPADLHDNAIILGCLSFFVAFMMLFDLADPMARHTTDTTQTDFPVDAPTLQENKILNRDQNIPTSTQAHVHDNHHNEDTASQELNTTNGQYTRGDEVDFVQSNVLPTAQQPIFEKVLLPEKLRPHRKNIQDPKVNKSKTEFTNHGFSNNFEQIPQPHHRSPPSQTNHAAAPRNLPPVPQRNFDRYDYRLNQDYSRQSTYNLSRNIPPRSAHSSYRRQNSCRRKGSCSSGDEDYHSTPVQPGFVAHAARIWDNRAKQTSELNTIV